MTYNPRMALFEPVLKALNDAQVRYVVVGGLAVVLIRQLETIERGRKVSGDE